MTTRKQRGSASRNHGGPASRRHGRSTAKTLTSPVQVLKVYTLSYRPFILGGDVNGPISTAAAVDSGPHKLGRGVSCYVVRKPNGGTVIAEATTGALIGPTLNQVIADVQSGDPQIMAKQMKQAMIDSKRATPVEPAEFWGRMRS